MPVIEISAIVDDGERMLLVQRPDGCWELPTGLLEPEESTEEALARILGETLGLRVVEQEFLETYYERVPGSGEPLLRNVYRVHSWVDAEQGPAAAQPALERASARRWGTVEDALELSLREGARQILLDFEQVRLMAAAGFVEEL